MSDHMVDSALPAASRCSKSGLCTDFATRRGRSAPSTMSASAALARRSASSAKAAAARACWPFDPADRRSARRIVSGEIRFNRRLTARQRRRPGRRSRGARSALEGDPRHTGPEIAMIFQEPMSSLSPVHPSATRSARCCACTSACPGKRRGARHRAARTGRHPQPAHRHRPLPVRIFGRHAAAR